MDLSVQLVQGWMDTALSDIAGSEAGPQQTGSQAEPAAKKPRGRPPKPAATTTIPPGYVRFFVIAANAKTRASAWPGKVVELSLQGPELGEDHVLAKLLDFVEKQPMYRDCRGGLGYRVSNELSD